VPEPSAVEPKRAELPTTGSGTLRHARRGGDHRRSFNLAAHGWTAYAHHPSALSRTQRVCFHSSRSIRPSQPGTPEGDDGPHRTRRGRPTGRLSGAYPESAAKQSSADDAFAEDHERSAIHDRARSGRSRSRVAEGDPALETPLARMQLPAASSRKTSSGLVSSDMTMRRSESPRVCPLPRPTSHGPQRQELQGQDLRLELDASGSDNLGLVTSLTPRSRRGSP
jgi:hypothetical protein